MGANGLAAYRWVVPSSGDFSAVKVVFIFVTYGKNRALQSPQVVTAPLLRNINLSQIERHVLGKFHHSDVLLSSANTHLFSTSLVQVA